MPADPADRNYLLGLLSVQCGFLGRDELGEAIQTWIREPNRPFEEILVERGTIAPADLDALRPVLDRQIAKTGDPGLSIASLRASEVDPYATRMPDPSATRMPDSGDGSASSATGGATSRGRYRKVRDHAEGGLGVVYVAIDRELNREVALKEIRDRHADDESSQARFMLEAEITGGLEHPGIVPVYGLGTHDDGRPYYAMRFIRGDSLKDAIAGFHADESLKADPGARALALQKLLRRFLDVCNAMAYAHSRGVVHRDLKPENVMVGRYGETLVVDWGLAKTGGHPVVHPGAAAHAHHEDVLHPTSSRSGSTNETLAGSVIGTPAYMSPEQASGQIDAIGPPSDVYSLGATLYVLLTGVTPFRATDLSTLLDRVIRGDFPSPRQSNANVPLALDAVCRKAMALRVEDRYQSPRDLADEIEQWMADEPVRAYREPFSTRAARWARRHKTLVTGVVVLLLTGGLALSVGYVVVRRERDDKDRLFTRSQKVVKDYLVTIADEPDLRNDALSPVRNRLLEKAGDYYKQFLAENRDNPNLRKESADAFYSLGTISYTYNLGSDAATADQAALDYHRTALELRKEQARSAPNDPNAHLDVASSEEAVGNQERQRSGPEHFERARSAYVDAIDELKRGLKVAPTDESSTFNDRIAMVSHQLGTLLIEAGRRDEALGPIREAIAIQRTLNADPAGHSRSGHLALFLTDMSEWHRKGGQPVEALALAREAQTVRASTFKLTPESVTTRYDLGLADFHLATLLLEAKQTTEAAVWYKQARELLEPLARDYPLRLDFLSMLARVFNGLGESRLIDLGAALGEKKLDLARSLSTEAIAYYDGHRTISLRLEAQRPGVGQYRSDVARSDRNIGSTLFLLGDYEQALTRTKAARGVLELLVRDVPSSVEFRSDLGAACNNLGLILGALGRREEAVEAFKEAITNQTVAFDRAPQYREFLFTIHVNRARLERDLKQTDAAVASLVEAMKLAASQSIESIGVAMEFAACLPPEPSAKTEPDAVRQSRARLADLAMEALRQGVAAGFRDVSLMEAQEALKPLRGRDDYRRLVDQMGSSRPPSP